MFLLSMLIRNVELMAMSFVVFSAEGHVDMWSTNKIIRYFCLFWFASSLLTCILTRWLLAVLLISRILPSTSVGYTVYTHKGYRGRLKCYWCYTSGSHHINVDQCAKPVYVRGVRGLLSFDVDSIETIILSCLVSRASKPRSNRDKSFVLKEN